MEIPGPDILRSPLPGPSRAAPTTAQLLQSFTPGQTLTAQVTRQLPDGNVELQIGNLRVSSQPPVPLTEGQPLLLRVDRVGKQSLDLRITNLPDPADIISRTLRESLPKQQPVGEVLQRFGRLLLQQAPNREALPAPLRQAIARLVQSLPDSRQLGQPDGLHRAIRQSGLLLESNLQAASRSTINNATTATAQAAKPEAGDLKANLLRVIESLRQYSGQISGATPTVAADTDSTVSESTLPRPLLARLLTLLTEPASSTAATPRDAGSAPRGLAELLLRLPVLQLFRGHDAAVLNQPNTAQPATAHLPSLVQELITALEAGIARIQLHQLASLPQADNDRPVLILDLPVRHEDNIEQLKLTIQRERKQGGAANEHIWRVSLEFDFAELGKVAARISIHNKQVNTSFQCSEPGTATLFGEHLDELQQRLQQIGLDPGHLESLYRQAGTNGDMTIPVNDGVLDTRA